MTTFTLHSTALNDDIIFQFPDEVVQRFNGCYCCRQFNRSSSELTMTQPLLSAYGSFKNFIFGTDTAKVESDAFTTSGYMRLALRASAISGGVQSAYADAIAYLQGLKVTVDNVDYPLSELSYLTQYTNPDYPVPITPVLYQDDLWGKTVVISGATPAVDTATFQNDLSDCTLSNVQTEYESGSTYDTYLTADSHYYFYALPFIRYRKGAQIREVNFTKVTDYQCSISFSDDVDDGSVISVVANSAICKPIKVNVGYDIDSQITLLNRPTEVFENELPKIYVLTKPSSLEWGEVKLTYYDRGGVLTTIYPTIQGDEALLTIPSGVLFLPDSTMSVSAHLISNERDIEYHLTNCTPNATPARYTLGETVEFEFTPATGFFFNTIVSLSYYRNGNQIQVDGYIGMDGVGYLTLELQTVDLGTPISVYATAIKEDSEIVKLYNNVIGVYKVSKENIEAIAGARYRVVDTEYVYHPIDLGEYIKSLRRYFFDVATAGRATIKLGNTNLNTVADVVEESVYEIDLGAKLLPRVYNTENDFTDIELIAVLPYADLTTLDRGFIGRTVRIVYKVNVVTDDCKILFTDDDTRELLKTVGAKVSLEIPYKTLTINSDYVENIDKDFYGLNLLSGFTPKIIMRSKKVVPRLHTPTNFTATLGNLTGYVAVSECDLGGIFALKKELDLIESELKSGIIL